jgi:hypothetical protein
MRIVEIRERFRSHFALCCSPGCTADADNEHRRRHHRCHHSGRSGDRLWVFVFGRYAQSELIHERFAPRLLHAWPSSLTNAAGTNLDPFRAWETMMRCEKPGGTANVVSRSEHSTWPFGMQRKSRALRCTTLSL